MTQTSYTIDLYVNPQTRRAGATRRPQSTRTERSRPTRARSLAAVSS